MTLLGVSPWVWNYVRNEWRRRLLMLNRSESRTERILKFLDRRLNP